MIFIVHVNAFKGQVHMFAGRVKIVSHSSCRTRAILKIFLSHAVETIPLRRYLQHCDAKLAAYVCCNPYENSRRNPPGIQAVSKRKGHGFEKILA